MSNVEGRYSVYFIKKTEQSETTLRNSTRLSSSQAAVRYSAVLRFAFQSIFTERAKCILT
jgi:hypothetical protein